VHCAVALPVTSLSHLLAHAPSWAAAAAAAAHINSGDLLQLPHRRNANAAWKLKSAGLFGKGKVLAVEATRAVRKGEALVMDYGPEKLDNALLLDHGVLDASSAKVSVRLQVLSHLVLCMCVLGVPCLYWCLEGSRGSGQPACCRCGGCGTGRNARR
jgi:hypothetical protein